MTRLAVQAGLDPRHVGDFDEDELLSLVEAVDEIQQERAWTNLHEGVAACVEALWAMLARLEAGIAVVQVKQTHKPAQPERYPRPDWISGSEPNEIVVTHVGDAIRIMKGGGSQ